MDPELKLHFQNILNHQDLNFSRVHGGDISEAYKITTPYEVYFCKLNINKFAENFLIESESLRYLEGKSPLKVPRNIKTDIFKNSAFLIMEFIPTTSKTHNFWLQFGKGLAILHKKTHATYGLYSPTYIGSIRVTNQWYSEWSSFYFSERLLPLMRSGFDQGIFTNVDIANLESFVKKLEQIVPIEIPALCHGDLWSGNFICNNGQGYLIDPSICYYHREMDLAMIKLFGGFHSTFHEAYYEEFPWAPGLDDRIDVHQLYYILVHALLFRGGYIHSVKSILQKYS